MHLVAKGRPGFTAFLSWEEPVAFGHGKRTWQTLVPQVLRDDSRSQLKVGDSFPDSTLPTFAHYHIQVKLPR